MPTDRDIQNNDEDGFDENAELRRLQNVLTLVQNADRRLTALQGGWLPPGPGIKPAIVQALTDLLTATADVTTRATALQATIRGTLSASERGFRDLFAMGRIAGSGKATRPAGWRTTCVARSAFSYPIARRAPLPARDRRR